MYLDEQLEQIWAETYRIDDVVDACIQSWGDPNKKGMMSYINSIRQSDSAWRAFANRHPSLVDANHLRRIILRNVDKSLELSKYLGW